MCLRLRCRAEDLCRLEVLKYISGMEINNKETPRPILEVEETELRKEICYYMI